MKAKFIDRNNIEFDRVGWNSEGTKHGLASEFDPKYMEYKSSDMPHDAPEYQSYQPYFEVVDGVIFQRWELPELSPEQAKAIIIGKIHQYDDSPAVNGFYVGGMPMWLSRDERSALKSRFEAEEAMGRTDTVLWYDGISLPLPLATARMMLMQVEIYAAGCFDRREQHIAAVRAMTITTDILEYDFKAGYPEKLNFNL